MKFLCGSGELLVKVHKRPGLELFLEEASSFCTLAVFTAGELPRKMI